MAKHLKLTPHYATPTLLLEPYRLPFLNRISLVSRTESILIKRSGFHS